MPYTFNSSIWERKTGDSLSLRLVWYVEQVPSQAGPQALLRIKIQKQKRKEEREGGMEGRKKRKYGRNERKK